MARAGSSARGQATVEWVGLVCLVSLLATALAALAGLALPGAGLASALAERLLCAAGLGGECGVAESRLEAAYGPRLAALVAEHAPTLVYEEGMRALPIDWRSCREDPCSLGAERGAVIASDAGLPVTLFTHVVDCAGPPAAADRLVDAAPACTGIRAGRTYLQYWAYYPGSNTKVWGARGFHEDDWESLQTRIDGETAESRASSHNGYNHGAGAGNWLSDAGIASKAGWGPSEGRYYVSGGSHAGHASQPGSTPTRWTPAARIRLIPLEPIAERGVADEFAVTPPWLKRVWSDPEYEGTD